MRPAYPYLAYLLGTSQIVPILSPHGIVATRCRHPSATPCTSSSSRSSEARPIPKSTRTCTSRGLDRGSRRARAGGDGRRHRRVSKIRAALAHPWITALRKHLRARPKPRGNRCNRQPERVLAVATSVPLDVSSMEPFDLRRPAEDRRCDAMHLANVAWSRFMDTRRSGGRSLRVRGLHDRPKGELMAIRSCSRRRTRFRRAHVGQQSEPAPYARELRREQRRQRIGCEAPRRQGVCEATTGLRRSCTVQAAVTGVERLGGQRRDRPPGRRLSHRSVPRHPGRSHRRRRRRREHGDPRERHRDRAVFLRERRRHPSSASHGQPAAMAGNVGERHHDQRRRTADPHRLRDPRQHDRQRRGRASTWTTANC